MNIIAPRLPQRDGPRFLDVPSIKRPLGTPQGQERADSPRGPLDAPEKLPKECRRQGALGTLERDHGGVGARRGESITPRREHTLFHGHALREVAELVGVVAAEEGQLVAEDYGRAETDGSVSV